MYEILIPEILAKSAANKVSFFSLKLFHFCRNEGRHLSLSVYYGRLFSMVVNPSKILNHKVSGSYMDVNWANIEIFQKSISPVM